MKILLQTRAGNLLAGVLLMAACVTARGQVAPADTTPPATPPPATTPPATTAPAAGQGTNPGEVVTLSPFYVSGQEASLISSQDLKENDEGIMDSIVASDIDKLPDVNVSYALERITGVQVAHLFAGVGGNGSVTIDGLTQVENTLDGHEVFTPGGISGGGVGTGERTFDYSSIPSALVAGIDVYKTSAANQLDGGLGGLIDVRLRNPFDFDGLVESVTVGTTDSSLYNETRPNYNVFISDSTKTDVGKIGVMADFSYQLQPWREDEIGVSAPTTAATAVTGDPSAIIPTGIQLVTTEGIFETIGTNGKIQWSPGPDLMVYVGYNYFEWKNTEDEFELAPTFSAATVVPGSGVLYPGNPTAVESATFNNISASAFGIIRDLTDRERMYDAGANWGGSGDFTLKFDINRMDTQYGFYNNAMYMSAAIPSMSYSIAGTIPSTEVKGASLTDPSIYSVVQAYNRLDPATAYETAGTLDGEYKMKGFISSLLAGFRYAGTEQDNGATGLFLGSYNPPAGATNPTRYGGLIAPVPVQNFFDGYHEPNASEYLAMTTSTLRNPAQLLSEFGDTTTTPSTDATVNPLSLYHIDEDTAAFYVMAKYQGNVGGLDFDGNIGGRFVETTDDLGGFQTVTPASLSSTGVAVLGPLALTNKYSNFLPSINYRLKFTDTFFLRLAASKTITRPNFSQMSPSLTLNANPITPSLDTGSQGNPSLKAMTSQNVDISLEKYFNKSTSIYVAGLYKDVSGFPASITFPEVYGGLTYQVSTYANLNPATIKGGEAGYQEFFSFLPAPFDGLGFQGNFTHVDSTTPSSTQGYNIPLTNLSRNAYNLVFMYEKGPFSARVAYNWRDDFVTGVSQIVGIGLIPVFNKAYGDLDASLNYSLTKNVELTVQGVNLTNALRETYYNSIATPSAFYLDGMTVMASVTIKL